MFEILTRFIPVLSPECFSADNEEYPEAVYRLFDCLEAFEDVRPDEKQMLLLNRLWLLRDTEAHRPGTVLRALRDGSMVQILKELESFDKAREPSVCAIGELLIDFGEEGEKDGFPLLQAMPGGAPANFLAALSRCGIRTSLIAKVGADRFGESLIRQVDALGIGTEGIVRDETHFTTLAFVTRDERGERRFDFARKHGADTQLRWSEVRTDLIDRADGFHFGSVSLTEGPCAETVKKAVARARSLGKLISFDPNLRLPLWSSEKKARQMIRWGLEQTDILKISEEELDFLKLGEPEKAAEKLMKDHGIALVMVTMGAGDIFGGSAFSRILKLGKKPDRLTEEDLAETAAFANAAAGLSVLKKGGMLSVPAEEEVKNILAKQATE